MSQVSPKFLFCFVFSRREVNTCEEDDDGRPYLHRMTVMRCSSLLQLLFSIALVVCTPVAYGGGDGSHGVAAWNREFIDWVPWSQAITVAKREKKPIMMVVHKTWCATCRSVGEAFAASPEIELLSRYFVMADVEDDDEPADKKYAVQGQYNPRILFLSPNGDVVDVINEHGDPAHLHFYPEIPDLVLSMIRALRVIAGIEDVSEL
jgi:hypothetical protein